MRLLGRIAVPLGLGAISIPVLIALGVQAEFAWAWGALLAAVVVMFQLRMPDDPRLDAPGRKDERSYVGSDVSRLAWAINLSSDSVSEAVTRRVRATLRRRLARRGIDLDDEAQAAAVEQQLGTGLWARLNGRRTSIQDIRDALAAAERLAPSETDAFQRETRS
ncbi:hypothetical protein [Microbacterium sp. H1-D42]|uniref:hypothetical protein n=1 Tax=Microbacterium sp. H1-D42 TaxID=2925844 RepID=UPI001F5387A5|nr:hypothetical protein [Microbacterium sp. H1-D42]UNK72161.1 hypothetical protein MNR00_06885 [Microbacterium sp. H1-D42]